MEEQDLTPRRELEVAEIQQSSNLVPEEKELIKSTTKDAADVQQSEVSERGASQARVIQPAGQVIDFSTLPRAAVDSSRFKPLANKPHYTSLVLNPS